MSAGRQRAMPRAEVERFADAVAELLSDPAAGLSPDARLRWEGALTAAEIILGRTPSLLDDEGIADDIRRLL
jgi:hypothetical protein